MKEIKAYIRSEKAEKVIETLNALNVCDMTLIDVMGLGKHLADPKEAKYSVHVVEKYSEIAKIEIVCKAELVDNIVETIRKTAYTGLKGDGMIYVTAVEMAVKIRSGAVGAQAL